MDEEDIWNDDVGNVGTSDYAVLKWYFENINRYPEPIMTADDIQKSVATAGVTMNDKGSCIDLLVFDEQEFFRTVSNLAPVLQAMNAKIVTVKSDDITAYDSGYTMRLAGGGLLN
jgi:hypothetical protein